MPDTTTILSLPHILPAQAQKHVTHNEALRLLDVMVQLSVMDATLGVPSGIPVLGDRHIIKAPTSGAWAGHANEVALWNGTAWEFFVPQAGWRAWVVADQRVMVFTGTAWTDPTPASAEYDQLGVGMAANTTQVLAVEGPASLFTTAGGGHQLAINRTTGVYSATLAFQTSQTTRAEIGNAGSGDLTVKVSPDGSSFFTAMTVDKDNGRIAVQAPMQIVPAAGDAGALTNGLIWYNSTTEKFRAYQNGTMVDLISAGGGGGGTVFADNVFRVQDNADATRQAAFEASAIATGTTRTFTLPDLNGTLALLEGAQTLTGAKTFAGAVQVTDANLTIAEAADPTKQARFSATGITTGTTRTFTLPNQNGTLAVTSSLAQTFTGTTTFSGSTVSFGTSTAASTVGVGTGATLNGVSKTVNLGTDGVSGSTTTINIGSAVGGALGTTVMNSPTLNVAATSVAMANANVAASQMGVGGATADATNRLSVAAPGVLFNHAGAGIETVLNRNAGTDDAKISFKSGFSTRAQLGILGNDNLALRVSANGTVFSDVLTAEAATGQPGERHALVQLDQWRIEGRDWRHCAGDRQPAGHCQPDSGHRRTCSDHHRFGRHHNGHAGGCRQPPGHLSLHGAIRNGGRRLCHQLHHPDCRRAVQDCGLQQRCQRPSGRAVAGNGDVGHVHHRGQDRHQQPDPATWQDLLAGGAPFVHRHHFHLGARRHARYQRRRPGDHGPQDAAAHRDLCHRRAFVLDLCLVRDQQQRRPGDLGEGVAAGKQPQRAAPARPFGHAKAWRLPRFRV